MSAAVTAWVGPSDIANMQDAVSHIVAGWSQVLLWLPHIDSTTPGASPALDFDTLRNQVVTANGPSFGAGWQLTVGLRSYGGYQQPARTIFAGIWNTSQLEVLTPDGIIIYSGATLVYQGIEVSKYDIIIDPSDTDISPSGSRYAVGDELDTVQAFGNVILRYAALEQRNVTDPIYSVPLV